MEKYYVNYWCDEAWAECNKILESEQELLDWVQDNPRVVNSPNSNFTIIKGREIKLTPVETVTSWRIDE